MSTAQVTSKKNRVNIHLKVPTDLADDGPAAISEEPRQLLAAVFVLYVKTENFHWHLSGLHFRDYHLLLVEQAEQIRAMADDLAKRARKIGGTGLHSIGDIARHQLLQYNSEAFVPPHEMLSEPSSDNQQLTQLLRGAHSVCDKHNDLAAASMIENWIDQTERRTWFVSESTKLN